MPLGFLDASALTALLPLPFTLAVAVIDLRRRIIPDRVNLALFGLGLAVTAWQGPEVTVAVLRLGEAVLALLLFVGLRLLHARLRGRIGLGLGDVKFIAAATAWTGLAGLPVLILAASTTALAAILVGMLAGMRIARTTRLPFGPFLALGMHVVLLVPHAG